MRNVRRISMIGSIVAALVVACAAMALTTGAGAVAVKPARVRLDAALDKPIMLADEKQTAYLRVGLVGFPLGDEADRTPVNIAIVVDKSGSMQGEKIARAKEAAKMVIGRLRFDDIISIVTYDSTVNVLVPATKVSDMASIFRAIDRIEAHGTTALFAGVSKGAEEVRKFLSDNHVNRVVLLSDGKANVGPSTPADLGALGSSLVREGISVTTIGLGLQYNEDLMTRLAFESDGNHYFAETAGELAGVFDAEFGGALCVVAQEVRTEIVCAPGVRPVRVLGRQAEITGRRVRVYMNQLYGAHEKFILLEVEAPATAADRTRQIAQVNVRYDNMRTQKTDRLNAKIEAEFSTSKELIERRTNAKVMVDVVHLIATERNELAMRLRDKGRIDEAYEVLGANTVFLRSNADRYRSEKLADYFIYNANNMQNLDAKNWMRERKRMQSTQFSNNMQQEEVPAQQPREPVTLFE